MSRRLVLLESGVGELHDVCFSKTTDISLYEVRAERLPHWRQPRIVDVRQRGWPHTVAWTSTRYATCGNVNDRPRHTTEKRAVRAQMWRLRRSTYIDGHHKPKRTNGLFSLLLFGSDNWEWNIREEKKITHCGFDAARKTGPGVRLTQRLSANIC